MHQISRSDCLGRNSQQCLFCIQQSNTSTSKNNINFDRQILTLTGSDVSVAASPVESKVSVDKVLVDSHYFKYNNGKYVPRNVKSVRKWSGSSGHRLYWFMLHEVTKSTVALCGQHVSPSQKFYKIPKIYMYRKGRQKSFGLQKITPTLIPLRIPLTFTCIWLRIWWGLLSLSHHITTSFSSSWLACGTWCSRGSWSCHYTWVRNQ